MLWPPGHSGGGVSDSQQRAGPAWWGGGGSSPCTSEDRSKDAGLLQKHRVRLGQRKESLATASIFAHVSLSQSNSGNHVRDTQECCVPVQSRPLVVVKGKIHQRRNSGHQQTLSTEDFHQFFHCQTASSCQSDTAF